MVLNSGFQLVTSLLISVQEDSRICETNIAV